MPPRSKTQLQRAGKGAPGDAVLAANRWREAYNPLRGLTMRRAVDLLERAQTGDFADLQWTYRFIEMNSAPHSALVSRCQAPLLKFNWEIKTISKLPRSATPAMAERQSRTARAAYDKIDNLRAAISHLALADFRGYSHLQKHFDANGDVKHLEILDQWNFCRDGMAGAWYWNQSAAAVSSPAVFLGEENRIGSKELPREDFIIRECERPIDRIGLINFIRRNLVEKDWDAFIEIYGIPGGVVTMPANVPQGKESEYQTTAKQVAEGGSGAVPNGSTYAPNDHPRNTDPFSPRRTALDEDLVIAGTGGKLTMLAQSGSGTLASGAHQATFNEIAQARAAQISEVFQRQFDSPLLRQKHPYEPALVYFELCFKEKSDVAAIVANVAKLKSIGMAADSKWLSEKIGIPFEEKVETE